jgi:hypothetical protein
MAYVACPGEQEMDTKYLLETLKRGDNLKE